MKTIMTTTALFLATTLTVSAAMSFNLNNISTEFNGALAEERSPREQQPSKAQKPVIKKFMKTLNEVQQVTAPDTELKATFDMMTQEIVRVQAVFDSGQYGQALNESKKLLDTVRIRTGIHPKAKITEKIEIKDVFEGSESDLMYSQLNQDQKEAIALAVLNHRGGLYLDILNQTKRASLIYIKSLHMRLKKDGPLLNEDILKIKSDLLAIMTIKIDLVQYDQNIRFTVRDSDIANSDQNYLFNREIKIFAIGNKDLNWTEETFDKDSKPVVKIKSNEYDLVSCVNLLEDKIFYTDDRGYKRGLNSTKQFRGICEKFQRNEIDCALNSYKPSDHRFYMAPVLELCSNKKVDISN